MKIKAVKTRKFIPPRDNLRELLSYLPKLRENVVVAAASKVVSIGEGRCVAADKIKDKDQLIKSEAEKYLPREISPGGWVMHTFKNNLVMPSAGIDESNAAGHYILWPKNPAASAKKIWKHLRQIHKIKNLGVIITDSRSTAFRRGIIGVSLAHWGFAPLRDYRKGQDIFGRPLKISQTNLADSLAAAAVLAMGEGGEQTPLAVIENIPNIAFVSQTRLQNEADDGFEISPAEDIYSPFFSSVKWRKGGTKKSG